MKRPPISLILALAGIAFAGYYLYHSAFRLPPQQPLREPAAKPAEESLAGVGIVEAEEEQHNVAPHFSGRVAQVHVVEGDRIQAGAPLYTLDTEQLQADLKAQLATVRISQATLQRLQNQPRREDIAPVQARVEAQQARLTNLQQQLARLQSVSDPRAVSRDQVTTLQLQVDEAAAQLKQAQADLTRLRAGAWSFELEEVRQQIAQAQQQANRIRTQMTLATVKAPSTGEILQVNVREGEFVTPGQGKPSVVLGHTDRLQVRVDVDEVNASRVQPGMAAEAALKGNGQLRFPLAFKRIQPLMVPKTNLTGQTGERTDVRVLQVIYSFQPPGFPVYVGQQVDVFLKNPMDYPQQHRSPNTPEGGRRREDASTAVVGRAS